MRILNVDLLVCDRCARRFELSRDQEQSGYGTLVLRAMRAERVDHGDLSPREESVLDLVGRGQSNKAIARALELAEATVKVHIKSILRKTRCRNRTQAAMLMRSDSPHGPERVTAAVEMTADLCAECVEGLRVFMRNGSSEAKQVAA